MALQFQNIEFFMDKGLDEKSDDKIAGFSQLDNIIWNDQGSASKRYGYLALSTGSLTLISGTSVPPVNDPWAFAGTQHVSSTFNDHVVSLATRQSLGVDEELIAVGSGSIWSWSPVLNRFIERGASRRSSVVSLEHMDDGGKPYGITSAIIGNIRVTTWGSSYDDPPTGATIVGSMVSIEDVATGRTIIPRMSLTRNATVCVPKVVASQNVFFILYADLIGATASLRCRIINPATPWSLGAEQTIATSTDFSVGSIGRGFEAMPYSTAGDGDVVLVAHMASGGDLQVRYLINTAGVVSSLENNNIGVSVINDVIGLTTALDGKPHVVVLFTDPAVSVGVEGVVFNADLTFSGSRLMETEWMDVSGNIVFDAVGRPVPTSNSVSGSTEWWLTFQGKLSGSNSTLSSDAEDARFNRFFSYVKKYVIRPWRSGDGSGTGPVIENNGVAFRHVETNGYPFTGSILNPSTGAPTRLDLIPLIGFSNQQSVGMLCDLSGNIFSVHDRDLIVPGVLNKPRPVVVKDDKTWDIPVITKGAIITAGDQSNYRTLSSFARFNLDPGYQGSTRAGDIIIRAGGMPRIYDGAQEVELGFHQFPQLHDYPTSSVHADRWATFTTGSGNNLTAGSYLYYGTWHWFDAQGREHRSNPGPGATVVVTASCGMTNINFPTLQWTQKDRVLAKLWRTLVNTNDARLVLTSSAGSTFEPLNVTTASYITMTDTLTDAALQNNEPLYTAGQLPNDPPPNSSLVTTWDNRVWLVDDTNSLDVWFSQKLVDALAPEFSTLLRVSIDPLGGRITGVAPIDDKLVVFKEHHIFVVAGSPGPDPFGQNGAYGVTLIQSDVGCIEPRSIIASSTGVSFMSKRGIYQLDRGLSLSYIGAPIEDDALAREIVGATNDSIKHMTRFSCRDGTTLVHDTLFDLWSRHTFSGSIGRGIDASTTWNNVHVCAGRLTGSGIHTGSSVVMVVNSGSFSDISSSFPMTITTPWWHLAGIEGFQRVQSVTFTGDFKSDHVIRVDAQYDYNDRPDTMNSSSIAQVSSWVNASSGSVNRFTVPLRQQLCNSIRFIIQDSAQSGSYESFRLQGVTLRVGVVNGDARLGPGRRPR